jgi:hypothetical protein
MASGLFLIALTRGTAKPPRRRVARHRHLVGQSWPLLMMAIATARIRPRYRPPRAGRPRRAREARRSARRLGESPRSAAGNLAIGFHDRASTPPAEPAPTERRTPPGLILTHPRAPCPMNSRYRHHPRSCVGGAPSRPRVAPRVPSACARLPPARGRLVQRRGRVSGRCAAPVSVPSARTVARADPWPETSPRRRHHTDGHTPVRGSRGPRRHVVTVPATPAAGASAARPPPRQELSTSRRRRFAHNPGASTRCDPTPRRPVRAPTVPYVA